MSSSSSPGVARAGSATGLSTSPSGTTTSSAPPLAPARRRQVPGSEKAPAAAAAAAADDDVMPNDGSAPLLGHHTAAAPASWAARNRWIVLAVASGACAAFNGVFAKLTTNSLTSHISQAITGALGMEHIEGAVEFVFRCMFFGLNLAFNGVMWTLFTKALARGSSTTQVSIMNTSANFVITALLGFAIFAEALPPLWWLGAAMLVAGNVIIGRKDDGGDSGVARGLAASGVAAYGAVPQVDGPLPVGGDEYKDEDVPLIGDVQEV